MCDLGDVKVDENAAGPNETMATKLVTLVADGHATRSSTTPPMQRPSSDRLRQATPIWFYTHFPSQIFACPHNET